MGDPEHGITGKTTPASLVKLFRCLIFQVPEETHALNNDSVFVDLGSGMGLPCFAAGCLHIHASIGFELCSLIVEASWGILKKIHSSSSHDIALPPPGALKFAAPVYFAHQNLTNLPSLEGATHVWCFSEGMGPVEHSHILRLCLLSPSVKVLAIACRDISPFIHSNLMSKDLSSRRPFCQFPISLQGTSRTCRVFLLNEQIRSQMRKSQLFFDDAAGSAELGTKEDFGVSPSLQLALQSTKNNETYEKWLSSTI